MASIYNIITIISNKLNTLIPLIFFVLMILIDLVVLIRGLHQSGFLRGLLFFVFLICVEFIIIILTKMSTEWIWWVFLYAASLIVYASTNKYGGRRGFYSYLGHLSIFFVGRLIGKWVGILFFSLPVLGIYYNTIYHMALAIVPASNPDGHGARSRDLKLDKGTIPNLIKLVLQTKMAALIMEIGGEKWQRFLVFLWYTWGIQFPMLVVTDSFGRQIEARIQGDSHRKLGGPGLICAQSHQAVGISTGIKFSRVDGPGIVFTHPYERLFQVVDLRTQLRTSQIEAISKDGNPFKAILFLAFAIDNQEWTVADLRRLQIANPILKNGKELDRNLGSYSYSQARVRAALSTTGVNLSPHNSETSIVHWDNWVVSQLEEAARFVLSQRNLDELWMPKNDDLGLSALNEIGVEIMNLTKSKLQEWGIRLFTARVVNFNFPEGHPIIKQQILTWSAVWEQRASQTLAKGEAESERLQQEAKAYANSILLTSLADGMEKTQVARPGLARNIIALRFIGALEELIQKQPSETSAEQRIRLNEIKQQILLSRSNG